MTPQTSNVCVTNLTDAEADIILFHRNLALPVGNPIESARWTVGAGKTSPYMQVHFNTGFGSWGDPDEWAIMLFVKSGKHAGTYWNAKSAKHEGWKECQLQTEDAGKSITFSVSTHEFDIALISGPCSDPMTKVAPAPNAPVTHVFVLMLENRSFDNMFAMSGINHIHKATTSNFNSYGGQRYYVHSPAPVSMTADPGHEFLDVLQQLTGKTSFQSGDFYSPMTNADFVANYATSITEAPYDLPDASAWGDIMACFDTPTQAPILYTLATQFGLCDAWFSSLPGPTWPNRFFVHGASSSGMDDSPKNTSIVKWEETKGFKYPNGSIFDLLHTNSIPTAIVYDDNGLGYSQFSDDPDAGSVFGATPQVWSLSGINSAWSQQFFEFQEALQGPFPYAYTFLEPHYGDVGGTYQGGSSQHPMDDLAGGERYLAALFNAIQDSPYWNSSLLIVLYDEHGGFYDSSSPPSAVEAPGDNPTYGYNTHGFDFTTLGVRVPAVVISPLVPAGSVVDSLYDHSSVPRTLEWLWKLSTLTKRDASAGTPIGLLSLSAPRTDKVTLPEAPAPQAKPARPSETERAALRARPMPERGNLVGTLGTLRKVDAELSEMAPDLASARPVIVTVGDAEDYARQVHAKLALVRARLRAAALAGNAPRLPVGPPPSPRGRRGR